MAAQTESPHPPQSCISPQVKRLVPGAQPQECSSHDRHARGRAPLLPRRRAILGACAGVGIALGLIRWVEGAPSAPAPAIDRDYGRGQLGGLASVLALRRDGPKLILGGEFSRVGSVEQSMVAVLNADGTLDTTFRGPRLVQGYARAVAEATRGRILVGGSFRSIDGHAAANLARFEADGRWDPSFPRGSSDGEVLSLLPLPDGRILVGGHFRNIGGGPAEGFARLHEDGSLDASFDPGFGGSVTHFARNARGNLYVGGNLSRTTPRCLSGDLRGADVLAARLAARGDPLSAYLWDHFPAPTRSALQDPRAATDRPLALRRTLARALSGIIDGGLVFDATRFAEVHLSASTRSVMQRKTPAWAIPHVNRMLLHDAYPDNVSEARGHHGSFRLLDDGSLDDGFLAPEGTDRLTAMTVQQDGKPLLAGPFSLPGGDFQTIVRLNPDGSLDPTFDAGTGADAITALGILPDGFIVAAGAFTRFNGHDRDCVAVLKADGSVDTGWKLDGIRGRITSLEVDATGGVYVGGPFRVAGDPALNGFARFR